MAADAAGEVQLTGARARVHGDGLLDDEAIRDQLADRLPRVGIADLRHLVGVEPDLALAAAEDRRGEPLLRPEVNPANAPPVSAKNVHFFCWRFVFDGDDRLRGSGSSSGEKQRIIPEMTEAVSKIDE